MAMACPSRHIPSHSHESNPTASLSSRCHISVDIHLLPMSARLRAPHPNNLPPISSPHEATAPRAPPLPTILALPTHLRPRPGSPWTLGAILAPALPLWHVRALALPCRQTPAR